MINKSQAFMWLLIVEFWLSGLIILGVIFLKVDDGLDNLTLLTFFAYSVGSFSAGILSDVIGRSLIFTFCSVLLFASSVVLIWDLRAGLILANLCIGPLNNLTFVYINENYGEKCQINTVKVLIGWAFSQITLGIFFLYFQDNTIFFYCLVGISFFYAIGALLLTQQSKQFQAKRQQLRQRTIAQIIIPSQIKSIIGGSILMFMMQMFYYRTQFTLDRFGVSLQINTIIVGVGETLANITFFKAVKQVRRKILLQILIGILMSLLLVLILVSSAEVQTLIEGSMRLVDTSIMLVLGVYIPQLFQIKGRGKGINYIMCFGVFGSALSGKVFSHLPFAYLQIFLFVAFSSSCFLPQTKLQIKQKDSLIEENSIQQQI